MPRSGRSHFMRFLWTVTILQYREIFFLNSAYFNEIKQKPKVDWRVNVLFKYSMDLFDIPKVWHSITFYQYQQVHCRQASFDFTLSDNFCRQTSILYHHNNSSFHSIEMNILIRHVRQVRTNITKNILIVFSSSVFHRNIIQKLTSDNTVL